MKNLNQAGCLALDFFTIRQPVGYTRIHIPWPRPPRFFHRNDNFKPPQAVADSERLDMYRLYIRKAEAYFGVTRTRDIHERALSALSDKDAQLIALDYANLEKKLGN